MGDNNEGSRVIAAIVPPAERSEDDQVVTLPGGDQINVTSTTVEDTGTGTITKGATVIGPGILNPNLTRDSVANPPRPPAGILRAGGDNLIDAGELVNVTNFVKTNALPGQETRLTFHGNSNPNNEFPDPERASVVAVDPKPPQAPPPDPINITEHFEDPHIPPDLPPTDNPVAAYVEPRFKDNPQAPDNQGASGDRIENEQFNPQQAGFKQDPPNLKYVNVRVYKPPQEAPKPPNMPEPQGPKE